MDNADDRYNDKKVYVIDVSQSVEHDHPRSLEFLRMDIKNVIDFFRKKGVTTLQERTAFEFITAENTSVDRNKMDMQIENLMQQDQAHPVTEEVDERVFRQAYIPKSLFEVVDPERDTGIIQQGGKDDLIYAKFLNVQDLKSQVVETLPNTSGLQNNEPKEPNRESLGDNTNEQSDGSDVSDEDESTSDDDNTVPRGKRHEDKDAKKVCLITFYQLMNSGTKTESQGRSSRTEEAQDSQGRKETENQSHERQEIDTRYNGG